MRTILVVDDDHGIRALLEDVLLDAGYNVLCASTVNEALETLNRNELDLIVLDLSLPEGEEELMKRVSSEVDGTKLLVLSGSMQLHERADALGANAALGKPFDIDELVEAVQRLCEGEMRAPGPSSAA